MLNITPKARHRTTVSVYSSVLSVLVQNIIPECIVLSKMTVWHYPPNRVTASEMSGLSHFAVQIQS